MSPLEEDPDAQAKYVLQNGDVVKVDLAVHIDGYIATAAHTTIVNPTPTEPFFGKVVMMLRRYVEVTDEVCYHPY
jgi:methionine aminopeptidase